MPKISKHFTTVYVHDVEFVVDFNYSPAMRGSSEYPGGPPIEPDEPADFELITVTSNEDLLDVLAQETVQRIFEKIRGNFDSDEEYHP